MRSCEEMAAEVFRRIESQTVARKKRKRAIVKAVSVACCFCLVALIGVGAWRISSTDATSSELSGEHSQKAGESSEASGDDTERNPLLYTSVIARVNGMSGEAVEDMYRPEGYHDNIASVLALKMSLHEAEERYLYHVVLGYWPYLERFRLDALLERVRPQTLEEQEQWVPILDPLVEEIMRLTGKSEEEALENLERLELHPSAGFYYVFTAEQIRELAEAGFGCHYVGSGEGPLPETDWEDPVFIEAFCERYGDGYTASDGSPSVNDPNWKIEIVDGEVISIGFWD